MHQKRLIFDNSLFCQQSVLCLWKLATPKSRKVFNTQNCHISEDIDFKTISWLYKQQQVRKGIILMNQYVIKMWLSGLGQNV